MADMSPGRRKVRRCLSIAVILLGTPAIALEDFSGSYLCIGEAAGGIYWYDERGQFGGATFKPSDKFIIKLTKEGDGPVYEGSNVLKSTYFVEVADFGEKSTTCYGLGSFGMVDLWDKDTRLQCTTSSTYWFDLGKMRYLRAYPYGYINGAKDNDDTPVIAGGTCAKI